MRIFSCKYYASTHPRSIAKVVRGLSLSFAVCSSVALTSHANAQVQYNVAGNNAYLNADVYGPVELSSLIYNLPTYTNWTPGPGALQNVNVYGQGATLNAPANWGGALFSQGGLQTWGSGELTINSNTESIGLIQANDNSTINWGPNATSVNVAPLMAGSSTFNMYGGYVGQVIGYGIQSLSSQPAPDSTINIYGGTISRGVTIIENDTLNIYGGSGTYGISASEDHGGDPQVNVYGTNLQVVDLVYDGRYMEPAIVGTLADGTVLSGVNGEAWNGSNGIEFGGDLNNLHFFAPSAAPEPSPFVALGIGAAGLALRRRKR